MTLGATSAGRAGDEVVDAAWRHVGEVIGAEPGYLVVEPDPPFQHEVSIPRGLVAGYQDGVVHLRGSGAAALAGAVGWATEAACGNEARPS